jgi:erythromycin esterase-like protein
MSLRNVLAMALLAAPLAASLATAQPNAKLTLDQALAQARTPLVLSAGEFSGAGAEVLNKAVEQSRFVLVGEDHFSHEIPQFANALCNIMHPDAYAVEAGPDAALYVSSLLHSTDRVPAMSARMKAFPNNMAFLDMSDENDLAAHCAASSRNPHFQLWGLDQELMGAAGTLLQAMAATHPGPVSSAAIAAAQVKEKTAEQAARATGDPGKLFLLASTDADVQALTQAIAVDGNAATRHLLAEFTASRTIYLLNAEGSPDSNRVRAELFKQHFLAGYLPLKSQTPDARILFKFGDYHVAKGFSPLHQRDLGNFIAELADGEKTQSLHILVLGVRGTHANFAGYGKPLGQEAFVMTDDPDYKWLAPALANLLPSPSADQAGLALTLFDLRQLRFHGIDLPPDWERTVYGYDLFVLIPNLTPDAAIE